jgi:hypothetical protein
LTADARQLSGPLRDADAVLDALVRRKDELGLADSLVDHLSGYALGGWTKRFGPSREKAPLLTTLMTFADVLGVSFVLIEDPQKARQMQRRWERRSPNHGHGNGKIARLSVKRALPAAIHKLASSGGKARWAGMSKKAKAAFIAKLNAARAAKRRRLAGMRTAA